MMSRRWFFACTMALSLAGAALFTGGAAAGASTAEMFQSSYDSEAAGKLSEALAALEGLPGPNRGGYVAELRRGWLLQRLGRNAESITAYRNAESLEPKSVEARVGELVPLIALRRWGEVETTARDVLRLDAGNYLANLRLAFAYYNLGRHTDAAQQYRKLLEAYPSDVEVRSGLAWSLLKMGRARDAAAEFRAVLAIAPRNALAQEGLKATGVVN